MKRLLPILVVALVTALPAATQAAQPPLHLIAASYSGFDRLGSSRGYYDRTVREMRIVTLDRPRGRPVTLPEGCSGGGVSLPDRLMACETAPRFRIFDTNSGALTPVDTSHCGDNPLHFGDLGRYWIRGAEEAGYDRGDVLYRQIYLNRTTGECRRFDPGQARDVDQADLPPVKNPSCADAGVRHVLKHRHPGFDVIFCHSKRKPLRVCRVTDCDPVLGRQTVAWLTLSHVTLSRMKAIRLDSGRRFSWRLAPLLKGHSSQVGHIDLLRDRVYLSLSLDYPDANAPPYRIFSTVLGR